MAYASSVGVNDPQIQLPSFINGLNIQIHREIFGKKFNTVLDAWFAARITEIRIEDEQEKESSSVDQQQSSFTISDPTYQHHQYSPSISNTKLTTSTIQHPDPTSIHQQWEQTKIQLISDSVKDNKKSDQKQEVADLQDDYEQQPSDTSSSGAPPTEADDDMDGKPNTNSGGTFVASGPNAISQTTSRGGGDDANLRSGSGTEVGAFATGEEERRDTSAMILQVVAAPIFSGDIRRGMVCCSPLVAKPSPLMAASFPWDGEGDSRTGKSSEREAVAGNKEANAMKVLKQDGDELQGSMMRTTTPWILGCSILSCSRGMRSTFWKMTHDGAPLGQHCVSDLGSITPCHGLG